MKKYLAPAVALAATLAAGSSSAIEGPAAALQNRTIAYVLSSEYYALYQTKDAKAECPTGFNDGPREQFKMLFPDDGTKRTVVDTQLAREAEVWFPTLKPEAFPFKEAQSKIAPGANLDGKVGPNDFTSPTGEPGIDNQLYRAIGCIYNYRDGGELWIITTKWRQQHNFNRTIIELTDVDSLVNDDDVTVTTYRGLDKLMAGATGAEFLPGGSQRVDTRWGKEFIYKFHGKIVNGELITEQGELVLPEMAAFEDPSVLPYRSAMFKLKLTPEKAEGVIAGYFDIEGWYRQLNQGWATHHQSYGQESAPSLYRALYRLADAFPDKTGKNTAISGALDVKFTQVFVQHPPQETSEAPAKKLIQVAH